MREILSKKCCGILLIIACCIYFLLNIVVWAMNLVVAISGAIGATIAFGLFLYFIRDIEKRKIKERASKEMKKTIMELGKDIDPQTCKRLNSVKRENNTCRIIKSYAINEDVYLKILKEESQKKNRRKSND